MTGRPMPSDAELRAMLEARADRVTAADALEVAARVRNSVASTEGGGGSGAGERGGRAFGVQRVRLDEPGVRRRGSPVPWRLAVLGVAAVVAVAVLGSRFSLAPIGPDTGASASASVLQTTGATPAPSPVALLTPVELQGGLTSGGLDGRVVLVRGQLVIDPWPCPSPVPENCFGIHIEGLDGVPVQSVSAITSDAIASRVGTDAPLALRVTGRSLSFLGWVVGGVDAPLPAAELATGDSAMPSGDIVLVSGWLLPKPAAAGCIRLALCEAWPRLTDSDPFIGSIPAYDTPGVNVGVDTTLRLDDPAQFMVGRFLLESLGSRESLLPPYRVVATLDAEVRRVDEQVTSIDPTPAPTPSASSTDDHMTAEDFARALRLGDLGGRVVVVEGRLRLTAGRCLGVSEDCTYLRLEGLDEVFIDKGSLGVDEAAAAIRRHPNVERIALRVTGTGAKLIGWISAGGWTPADIPALLAGNLPLDPGDVAVVAGWVIGAQTTTPTCPSTAASRACPGAWPWLTASAPLPDGTVLYGTDGTPIVVADVLGLGAEQAEIAGPFVVEARRAPNAGEPPFEIVDRFADAVTVDRAPFESSSPAPGPTPTTTPVAPISPAAGRIMAGELMTALTNGSLDGRILTLEAELKTVAWPCPVDVPEPCSRFYVDGLPGIALTYDGAIGVSDGSDGGAGVSKMAGTMVVVPRHGHLELLGRLDIALDSPAAFGPVFDGTADPFQDPFEVTPVIGWLIRDAVPADCPSPAPGTGASRTCSSPVDVLSDQPPMPPDEAPMPPDEASSGPAAVWYAVDATKGPGLEQVGASVAGPFLVRPEPNADRCPPQSYGCTSIVRHGWKVVTRYDPSVVLRVVLP